MTIFHSDVECLSQYSPVKLHLSPGIRILNENPASLPHQLQPLTNLTLQAESVSCHQLDHFDYLLLVFVRQWRQFVVWNL